MVNKPEPVLPREITSEMVSEALEDHKDYQRAPVGETRNAASTRRRANKALRATVRTKLEEIAREEAAAQNAVSSPTGRRSDDLADVVVEASCRLRSGCSCRRDSGGT